MYSGGGGVGGLPSPLTSPTAIDWNLYPAGEVGISSKKPSCELVQRARAAMTGVGTLY